MSFHDINKKEAERLANKKKKAKRDYTTRSVFFRNRLFPIEVNGACVNPGWVTRASVWRYSLRVKAGVGLGSE